MHQYYVGVFGLNAPSKTFNTRKDAEIYMQKICNKSGITVECVEDDKHWKSYADKTKKVVININRV